VNMYLRIAYNCQNVYAYISNQITADHFCVLKWLHLTGSSVCRPVFRRWWWHSSLNDITATVASLRGQGSCWAWPVTVPKTRHLKASKRASARSYIKYPHM
jgi:hypothetical protein